MAEIPEIHDRETLEARLNAIIAEKGEEEGRRIAVMISHRCAMRVLPEQWGWLRRQDLLAPLGLTALPILRLNLNAGVAQAFPTAQLSVAMAKAADAARNTIRVTAHDAHGPARAAAEVCNRAAVAFVEDNGVAALLAAINSMVMAATYEPHIWLGVSDDLKAINGIGQYCHPLWSRETNLAAFWRQVRADITAADDHADWTFWVNWYDEALDGTLYRPENEALLTAIALIDDEDWQQGPARMAEVIEGLRLKHAVAASPNAERIVLNEETKRFESEPVSGLPAASMAFAVDKLRAALAVVDVDASGNDPFGMLSDERDMLREAVNGNDLHPAKLHDLCLRISRRVNRKAEAGDIPKPDRDADIDDFLQQVDETALDLLADPEVKERVSHRAMMRLERMSDADKAMLPEAAKGLIPATSDALGKEMIDDAAIIVDLQASEPERRNAAYQMFSRVGRMYAIARKAGTEVVLVAAGVGAVFKSAGVIIENWHAVSAAIALFMYIFGL